MKSEYDLIIVGSGPAGLTAAIYAARYKLNVLVIGKLLGGLAGTANKIWNFPSYIEINGIELMLKMNEQVKKLGVEIIGEEVVKVEGSDGNFIVKTKKKEYFSKKIVYASGTVHKKLGAKNEDKFLGKGVAYCATCDATFYKDKKVGVVGGGDSALTAALLLSEFANEVIIIYRGADFKKANPSWVEQVEKNKKIKILFNEEVSEINGSQMVEGVKLKSGKDLELGGVFIEIGSVPDTYVLSSLKIKRDEKGYIIVDRSQKTSVVGFYAAGDVTNGVLKQIVIACGEGAVAGFGAYREIKDS